MDWDRDTEIKVAHDYVFMLKFVMMCISLSVCCFQSFIVSLSNFFSGEAVNRTDLKYMWHVSGSSHVSATPLLKLTNITSEVLQVSLNVANQGKLKHFSHSLVNYLTLTKIQYQAVLIFISEYRFVNEYHSQGNICLLIISIVISSNTWSSLWWSYVINKRLLADRLGSTVVKLTFETLYYRIDIQYNFGLKCEYWVFETRLTVPIGYMVVWQERRLDAAYNNGSHKWSVIKKGMQGTNGIYRCNVMKGNDSYVDNFQFWFFNSFSCAFHIKNATFWSKPH